MAGLSIRAICCGSNVENHLQPTMRTNPPSHAASHDAASVPDDPTYSMDRFLNNSGEIFTDGPQLPLLAFSQPQSKADAESRIMAQLSEIDAKLAQETV